MDTGKKPKEICLPLLAPGRVGAQSNGSIGGMVHSVVVCPRKAAKIKEK